MEKPIYDYQFSTQDFKGRLAYTMFFAGCNLRCHFCHNKDIANASEGQLALHTTLALIECRGRSVPGLGIVLSGGEPTASPAFAEAVKLFEKFPLAIHTNGILLPIHSFNKFESVALSIKGGVGYEGNYEYKIAAALDYYREAKHKEVRIVDTGSQFDSTDKIMGHPSIASRLGGWTVNRVKAR